MEDRRDWWAAYYITRMIWISVFLYKVVITGFVWYITTLLLINTIILNHCLWSCLILKLLWDTWEAHGVGEINIYHPMIKSKELCYRRYIHVPSELYCHLLHYVMCLNSYMNDESNTIMNGIYMFVFYSLYIFTDKRSFTAQIFIKFCVHRSLRGFLRDLWEIMTFTVPVRDASGDVIHMVNDKYLHAFVDK